MNTLNRLIFDYKFFRSYGNSHLRSAIKTIAMASPSRAYTNPDRWFVSRADPSPAQDYREQCKTSRGG